MFRVNTLYKSMVFYTRGLLALLNLAIGCLPELHSQYYARLVTTHRSRQTFIRDIGFPKSYQFVNLFQNTPLIY